MFVWCVWCVCVCICLCGVFVYVCICICLCGVFVCGVFVYVCVCGVCGCDYDEYLISIQYQVLKV